MNTVKPFDPMGHASVELGSKKLNTLVNENNANQIMPGGKGIRVTRTSSGIAISAIRQRPPKTKRFPFEMWIKEGYLCAAPGLIGDEAFAETLSTAPPLTDGTWYLLVTITIDPDTGDITDQQIGFTQSPPADTTSDYHKIIAEIEVVDGVADSSTIQQYNYGPLYVYIYGGISSVWSATIN